MNAKIVALILNSIESHISIALKGFSAAEQMFEYLREIYQQSNLARKYQVERDIFFYRQDDKNMHEYHSGYLNRCSDYEMLYFENIPEPCCAKTIQKLFEEQKGHATFNEVLLTLKHL